MNTGRVLVGWRLRGGPLQIQVWDTGIGISQSDQVDIFKEFFKLEQTKDKMGTDAVTGGGAWSCNCKAGLWEIVLWPDAPVKAGRGLGMQCDLAASRAAIANSCLTTPEIDANICDKFWPRYLWIAGCLAKEKICAKTSPWGCKYLL